MSQLPSIPAIRPASRDAVGAKTFNDGFVTRLTINAKPGQAWQSAVTISAYDAESGELGPDGTRIEFDDIRAFAERRAADGKPAMLQALGAVLQAVIDLSEDQAIKATEENGVIEIKEPDDG